MHVLDGLECVPLYSVLKWEADRSYRRRMPASKKEVMRRSQNLGRDQGLGGGLLKSRARSAAHHILSILRASQRSVLEGSRRLLS